jgi:hypothetical protein
VVVAARRRMLGGPQAVVHVLVALGKGRHLRVQGGRGGTNLVGSEEKMTIIVIYQCLL